MTVFKCKICGGSLSISDNDKIAVCDYCGTKQTLPKLDDEKRVQLYDRANYFRRENEFDKAMGIYEMILSEDKEDYEAYWGIVLCRYGIQYVKDPRTSQRIPTVNRSQFTSIYEDKDYLNAIKYSNEMQREIFTKEANLIDKIQKGILEISSKEEPFDVFICYKETDKNGNRTQDSVYAQDIYTALTKEEYKVFFSRITLEDKLGSAYEPYIFAALNSAKVMLVVGAEKDNFNAVWVKNEWSRYISLIKAGKDKTLIPVYKDMSPYDMPEEFTYLQSQDMGKIGYLQDLIHGVKKLVDVKTTTVQETVVVNNVNTNTAPLLKRAFMFLEDGDFARADEFCEQVLNLEPECAEAYLGKLLADLEVRKIEDLGKLNFHFDKNPNYQKVYRFADKKLKTKLDEYLKQADINLKEKLYVNFIDEYKITINKKTLIEIAEKFKSVSGYKEADTYVDLCYEKAETIEKETMLSKAKEEMSLDTISSYENAIEILETIPGWEDADEMISFCVKRIDEIKTQKRKRDKRFAIIYVFCIIVGVALITLCVFLLISGIKNDKSSDLSGSGKNDETVSISEVISENVQESGEGELEEETKDKIPKTIAGPTIATSYHHTVGIKSDGTVVATVILPYSGYDVATLDRGQLNVSGWTDIVAISAGEIHTVGLKSNGTVIAVGDNKGGQCNVGSWMDIVAISASDYHTVGLKSDGTVVATNILEYYEWSWIKNPDYGQCNVGSWTDIVAISAGNRHTVGLKSDGTVVAVGRNDCGQCDVDDWTDVVAVSAGLDHTVGLKSDGTVVVTGSNTYGQCDVDDWTDIVAISACANNTIGIKCDGTVVARGVYSYASRGAEWYTELDDKRQCDVTNWTDIVAISAGANHTVGLKSDGTIVATGWNFSGQCDVGDWKNIKIPDNKLAK